MTNASAAWRVVNMVIDPSSTGLSNAPTINSVPCGVKLVQAGAVRRKM